MKTKPFLSLFFARLVQRSSSVRLAHFITQTDWTLAGASSLAMCAVARTKHHAPARARTYQLIVQVSVMVCAATALVGCASTNHQVSPTAYDDSRPPHVAAPPSLPLPQQAVPSTNAFRSLDLNADGSITLDEWQQFDKTDAALDNFQSLDENGDGQINESEFLTQAPTHSKRYHFLGDTDETAGRLAPMDNGVFQNPGWQLFSFHF